MQPHQQFGCIQAAQQAGGSVTQHDLRHGQPLAAVLGEPAFVDRHLDGHQRPIQAVAGFLLDHPGAAGLMPDLDLALLFHLLLVLPDRGAVGDLLLFGRLAEVEAQRAETAATVDRGDDELAGPGRAPLDHIQVLHDH
ncbi:hypothetical protein D3C76_1419800 [compost metagenome]